MKSEASPGGSSTRSYFNDLYPGTSRPTKHLIELHNTGTGNQAHNKSSAPSSARRHKAMAKKSEASKRRPLLATYSQSVLKKQSNGKIALDSFKKAKMKANASSVVQDAEKNHLVKRNDRKEKQFNRSAKQSVAAPMNCGESVAETSARGKEFEKPAKQQNVLSLTRNSSFRNGKSSKKQLRIKLVNPNKQSKATTRTKNSAKKVSAASSPHDIKVRARKLLLKELTKKFEAKKATLRNTKNNHLGSKKSKPFASSNDIEMPSLNSLIEETTDKKTDVIPGFISDKGADGRKKWWRTQLQDILSKLESEITENAKHNAENVSSKEEVLATANTVTEPLNEGGDPKVELGDEEVAKRELESGLLEVQKYKATDWQVVIHKEDFINPVSDLAEVNEKKGSLVEDFSAKNNDSQPITASTEFQCASFIHESKVERAQLEEINKINDEARLIQDMEKEMKANYDKMLTSLEGTNNLTQVEYQRKKKVINRLYTKKLKVSNVNKKKVITETLNKVVSLIGDSKSTFTEEAKDTIKTTLSLVKEMIEQGPLEPEGSSSSMLESNTCVHEAPPDPKPDTKTKPLPIGPHAVDTEERTKDNNKKPEAVMDPHYLIEQSKLSADSDDLAKLFKNFMQATDESHATKNVSNADSSEKDNGKSSMIEVIVNEIYKDIVHAVQKMLLPTLTMQELPRGIYTTLSSISNYIDELIYIIMKDPEMFIGALSMPLIRDPLFILGQIQNESCDYYEAISKSISQSILPIELYLSLETTRNVDSISSEPTSLEHKTQLAEWSNIHNKAVFDAFNDALDYYRPYDLKGPPLPWSVQVRTLTFQNGDVNAVQDLLLQAKARVLSWAMTKVAVLSTSSTAVGGEGWTKLRNERLNTSILNDVRLA